jgi:hypothetical protein
MDNPLMVGQKLVEDLRELADFLEQRPELAMHTAYADGAGASVRVLAHVDEWTWPGLTVSWEGELTTVPESPAYYGQLWLATNGQVSFELFTNTEEPTAQVLPFKRRSTDRVDG